MKRYNNGDRFSGGGAASKARADCWRRAIDSRAGSASDNGFALAFCAEIHVQFPADSRELHGDGACAATVSVSDESDCI